MKIKSGLNKNGTPQKKCSIFLISYNNLNQCVYNAKANYNLNDPKSKYNLRIRPAFVFPDMIMNWSSDIL